MTSSFNDFELHPAILRGVAALGYDTPTPVQSSAIPLVLAGRDAIVQAKTGSGKTLAFGLPLLSMLKPQSLPQTLIVLPTRELAIQVCESLASVSKTSPLRVLPIYGGVGLGPQESALAKGIDVVVGTPGRLKDLINRGSLNLSQCHMLVLDEADEMLDMGFRRDIDFLLARLPKLQQTLIFSATMPPVIEAIARKHLKDPAIVKLVPTETVTPSEISHHFVRLKPEQRLGALITLLEQESPERAIIFTRMKHETKKLAAALKVAADIDAGFLNGNMSQNARNTMMARFKAGEFKYLIATDVAARGLHVDGLSHVFHYAVPTVVETYIHRSGRTGRAGSEGKTITFVVPDEEADFKQIQKRVSLQPVGLDLAALPDVPQPIHTPPPPRGGRNQPRKQAAPAADRPATGRGDRQPVKPGDRQPGARPAERGAERPASGRNAQPERQNGPRSQSPERQGNDRGRRAQPGAAEGWRKFKVALPSERRENRESCHRWLVSTAGVDRNLIRSVELFPDHVTFEVANQAADRLVERLRRAMA